MKNLLIISFVLLLMPALTRSQEAPGNKNPTYLDFSAGVSIPVGKNYPGLEGLPSSSKSGYASTGMFISGAVAFMGKGDFGIGANYVYQKNNFQDSAKNIPISNDHYLGSDGWSNHYLMGGFFLVKELGKYKIVGQVTGGLLIAFSPVFSYLSATSGQLETNAALGFGYGLNVSAGYNISPKTTLMVKAGYLGGNPNLSQQSPVVIVGYDTNGVAIYSDPQELNIKKVVSSVSIGVGITVKL